MVANMKLRIKATKLALISRFHVCVQTYKYILKKLVSVPTLFLAPHPQGHASNPSLMMKNVTVFG